MGTFYTAPELSIQTICKYCEKPQDRSGGSTSNMIKHLENVHIIDSRCRKRPHPQPQKAKELRQVTEFSQRCDRLLTEWICSGFQAFEVVENEFFKRFIHALNEEYKLPSRKTVSERLVPELAAVVEIETKAVLSKATDVVITTDGWTSNATENFLALTGHFIQEDKFTSIALGVEKLVDQTAIGHANAMGKNNGEKFFFLRYTFCRSRRADQFDPKDHMSEMQIRPCSEGSKSGLS